MASILLLDLFSVNEIRNTFMANNSGSSDRIISDYYALLRSDGLLFKKRYEKGKFHSQIEFS